MEIRKTIPDKKNKYYLKTPFGYNKCILGNPDNRYCPHSVLANCTGYSLGRYHEILGNKSFRYIGPLYPGDFMAKAKAQGLPTGQTPRVGSIVVMVKADGLHGHVFNIEKASGGRFMISESGWNFRKGLFFRTRWTSKSENFGMSAEYKFAGCIYNAQIDPYDVPPADFSTGKTPKSKYVKFVQWALIKELCYEKNVSTEIDGSAGSRTIAAIKVYQKKNGLKVDGHAGPATIANMKAKYTLE